MNGLGLVGVDVERDGHDLEALREPALRSVPATRAGRSGSLTTTPTRPATPSGRAGSTSRNGLPSASGSSRSGATAVVSARPVPAVAGTERPDAVRGVGDERHAEPLARAIRTSRRPSPTRTPCRERDADLALARALGLDRPAGARFEYVRVDLEIVQDHGRERSTPKGRRRARAPLLVRDAALGRADLGAVPGLRPLDRLRADGQARRRALSGRRAPQRPAAARDLQDAVRPGGLGARARHRRRARARATRTR